MTIRLSIKSKIQRLALMLAGSIVLICFGVFYLLQSAQFKQSLIQRNEAALRLVNQNIGLAVELGNTSEALNTLRSLQALPEIAGAAIFKEGKQFTGFSVQRQDTTQITPPDSVSFVLEQSDYYLIGAPILDVQATNVSEAALPVTPPAEASKPEKSSTPGDLPSLGDLLNTPVTTSESKPAAPVPDAETEMPSLGDLMNTPIAKSTEVAKAPDAPSVAGSTVVPDPQPDASKSTANVLGVTVIRVSKAELTQKLLTLLAIMGGMLVALFFVATLVASQFQRTLSWPIIQLRDLAARVMETDNYALRTDVATNDEIGDLAHAMNRMLDRVDKQKAEIQQINAELEQRIEDRVAELKEAKLASDQATEKAQLAEKQATAIAGELKIKQEFDRKLALVSEEVRFKTGETVEDWSFRTLTYIAEQVGAIRGAVYVGNRNTSVERLPIELQKLERVAYYGLSEEEITAYVPAQPVGLAFEALRNGQAIYRDCPPENQPVRTSSMTFGLQHVAYIPMIAEQEVIGLVELANPVALEPLQRQFLEAASQIIAYSVLILLNNLQIEKLLSEAQVKNTELLAREEELRQNLEELEATQEEMRRAQNELQKLNSNLENIVSQRTQELEVTLNELKNTQDQMVLNEKMSALGQLVAGIAHELNSPLGAIKASSESVLAEFGTVAENLPQLFVSLPPELQPLFLDVLKRLTRQRDDVHLSSREMRKLRKEIAGELENYGLPEDHAQDVASRLTEIGLISEIQPFYPLFVYDQVNLAEVLFAIGQLHINLDNIHVAAKRTQRIVYALKNYTHSSLNNEKQPTDLASDIDTVLTLYTNQLKKGIDIVKRYDLHTPVPAFSDELNQVWTNFLQNAIQAMQGEGRLEIGVYQQDDAAVVEFIDSGPGMPPEVQARVFEAFYTTKAKGEGTGLGLNICRKIIDKHGGTINVESEPGRTRFWVTLPLSSVPADVSAPQIA